MTSIKTIVFDLDGTLIDSSALISRAFNHALSPFNISLTLEEIDAMRSLTANELFTDKLTPKDAKQAVTRLWDYSIQSVSETILFPDMKTLLEKISAKGLTIGLWTGRDRKSAASILKHHDIDAHFKSIVGGCEVEKNKPHPEGLHLLANRLETNFIGMLHVGDHEHDLIGAKAAGVTSILAKWKHNNQTNQQLANHSFDTIKDFESWLNL